MLKQNYCYAMMVLSIVFLYSCGNESGDSSTRRAQVNLPLVDSLRKLPHCKVFEIVKHHESNLLKWSVRPTDYRLIPNNNGHYLVPAEVIMLTSIRPEASYVSITTPERILGKVILLEDDWRVFDASEKLDLQVIPSVASECFGKYEMYYSQIEPDIGLNVLMNGLEISEEKSAIAEDIGYILRDENRFHEALGFFQLSYDKTPSSEDILMEIQEIQEKLLSVPDVVMDEAYN